MTKKNKKKSAVKSAKAKPASSAESGEATTAPAADTTAPSGDASVSAPSDDQPAQNRAQAAGEASSDSELGTPTSEAAVTVPSSPEPSESSKPASELEAESGQPTQRLSPADSAPSKSSSSNSVSKTMTAATDNTKNPNKAVWFGLLVVAVFAFAATGYLWQQGQRQQLLLQSDINAALQRVDQQAESSRQLQRDVDRAVAAANQQAQQGEEAMQLVKKQLQSQQQRLQSLSTTDRNDWLLAETEYLIRLANQRLLMGKEVAGALALLKAADDIVRELDDSALFTVREALAKDIAALRQAAKLDVEGVYLQLGGLAVQADQLRLFAMPTFEAAVVELNQEPKTWRQRLDAGVAAAWQKLSSYIQIKHRDDVYKPLLAPEYEAAVRQNVRLMFEQSQMAVLAGKQALYVDSLNKVSQWLNNYYTLDSEKTALLVAQINEMKALRVTMELPDISASLRALKAYVELIHDVPPSVPAGESQSQQGDKP